MDILKSFDLTTAQWIWVIVAAFIVGFSKTGIGGASMLVIPILAEVFGGKGSTGILLPMLLVGDVFAVKYYNRHANWRHIRKLMPWVLVGLCAGVIVGSYINDQQFKLLIAASVFICLAILVYSEIKGDEVKVPHKLWFYALTGMACGFTSMIGNAAGPIFTIYLLARGFKKNNFMGTMAWFFLIINLLKMPLQIFFWQNITLQTGILALVMLPPIALGAVLGIALIKKIPEKPFRYMIIVMTALTALKLIM